MNTPAILLIYSKRISAFDWMQFLVLTASTLQIASAVKPAPAVSGGSSFRFVPGVIILPPVNSQAISPVICHQPFILRKRHC